MLIPPRLAVNVSPLTGRRLADVAVAARRRVLHLAATMPVHLGASLSVVDILVALYGGVLWGLSPFQLGISWQGHLGGLLGGLGFARIWPAGNRRSVPALQSRRSLV